MIKKTTFIAAFINIYCVTAAFCASNDFLSKIPGEFHDATQHLVTIKNPDWISIDAYEPPKELISLVPFQFYTYLINGSTEEDLKTGMYIALMSDGHKYFLKRVMHGHNGALGELVTYEVSKELGFNLVPPCFLLTITKDIKGFRADDLSEDAFKGKPVSLEGQTFTAHYFVEGETCFSVIERGDSIAQEELPNFLLFRNLLGVRDNHAGNAMIGWGRLIAIDNESCFEKEELTIVETNLSADMKERLKSENFWTDLFDRLKKGSINPTSEKFQSQPWLRAQQLLLGIEKK